MRQRHYHLYILLQAIAMTIAGGVAAVAVVCQWGWPIVVAAAGVCVWYGYKLWSGASYIPQQVDAFLGSLLSGDMTSHYADTADNELKQMYKNMNKIMQSYGKTQMDLATKRLYYDRILRIMTHELRNSITPVISLSEDMIENEYSKEDAVEALTVINKQCTDIKSFLDSYYELTHLPKPEMKNIEMRQMLNELAMLYSASEGVELSIQCGQGIEVRCDKPLIRQVLTNLIKNGIEAARGAGREAQVVVTATSPNGKVRITVSDNGPGVPAERLEEIFLPFYTSKQGGSGIGLAISRQIMELHGGTLTCTSFEGSGATFIMEF